MDFESPDVERDFPGLYASESGSGKRSQESDFSDDAHERSTKKELLIGKRKDKKESKRDQGYAALEGESSPEEEVDVKSPCKSKKSKSFKFPTIKEKREKSREKDVKDKEKEKDKDIDRDKEKKKESKSKLKLKEKKKVKSGDDATELVDEMPVFGVPLSVAVERSHCHDGIKIPVVLRNCIDHVEVYGLGAENIYKVSGVKSKVQQIKRKYNKRETVNLDDFDLPTVTSLLKTFLRELPDPIFTVTLASKFEEAANIKELASREHEFSSLLAQLPMCNHTCLSWLMRHLGNVAANECQNKMSISALGALFGPVLQTSPRVVSAVLALCSSLFPNIKLLKYIPPLSAGCTSLPSSREAIASELAKQESLLNQIHSEMNSGCTIRSDQLWEVQRFITLLKRKLRSLEKAQDVLQSSTDKLPIKTDTANSMVLQASSLKALSPSPLADKIDFQLQVANEEGCSKGASGSEGEDMSLQESSLDDKENTTATDAEAVAHSASAAPVVVTEAFQDSLARLETSPVLGPIPNQNQQQHVLSIDAEERDNELYLQLEHIELVKLLSHLSSRISLEREELEVLRAEYNSLMYSDAESSDKTASSLSDMKTSLENLDISNDETDSARQELLEQNSKLVQERISLARQIMTEQEACINLRVQIEALRQRIEPNPL